MMRHGPGRAGGSKPAKGWLSAAIVPYADADGVQSREHLSMVGVSPLHARKMHNGFEVGTTGGGTCYVSRPSS